MCSYIIYCVCLHVFLHHMCVCVQIFNEFNARILTDRLNVFKNLHREPTFVMVILVSMGCQALIVELGGNFTKTTGLIGLHWLYTLLLASLTLPLGVFMRFIPVSESPTAFADHYHASFAKRMLRKLAEMGDSHPAFTGRGVVAPSALQPLASPTASGGGKHRLLVTHPGEELERLSLLQEPSNSTPTPVARNPLHAASSYRVPSPLESPVSVSVLQEQPEDTVLLNPLSRLQRATMASAGGNTHGKEDAHEAST
jgi:hypothetical protein